MDSKSYYLPVTLSIATSVVCALLVFVGIKSYKRIYGRLSELPNGPIGLPILGYMPFLTDNLHIKFRDHLSRVYGKVFSFKFGNRLAIVINDWETLKHSYVNNGNIFLGRPNLILFRMMNKGHGILYSEGKYYKDQKKFMAMALKSVLLTQEFENSLQGEMKNFCHEIDQLIATSSPSGIVSLNDTIQFTFINVVALMAFGQTWDYRSEKMNDIVQLIHQTFEYIGRSAAVLNFLPEVISNNRLIRRALGYDSVVDTLNGLTSFVIARIYECISEYYNDPNKCSNNVTGIYLQKLITDDLEFANLASQIDIKAVPQNPLSITEELMSKGVLLDLKTGNELNNENYRQKFHSLKKHYLENCLDKWNGRGEQQFIKFLLSGNIFAGFSGFDMLMSIMDAFTGGTETSQTVMKWAIWFMAKNEACQARVHEEVADFFGKKYLTGKEELSESHDNAFINYKDRAQLPYTMATLSEIQRRACIAPISLFHSNLKTIKNFGERENFVIPERSIIIANHWAIHHDPKYWPLPFKFDPNRFLDVIETGHKISDERCPSRCSGTDSDQRDVSLNNNSSPAASVSLTLEFKNKHSLVPFSLGPRLCWGINLAKLELFTYFACIMLKYRFSFMIDSHEDEIEQDSPEAGKLVLTWSPTWKFVRVEKR